MTSFRCCGANMSVRRQSGVKWFQLLLIISIGFPRLADAQSKIGIETDEPLAADRTVLVFQVVENPIVRQVEYRGSRKVKRKVFDSLTQLKAGSPFDVDANRECARRIEEYCHEKGYVFATVEPERGNGLYDCEVVFQI